MLHARDDSLAKVERTGGGYQINVREQHAELTSLELCLLLQGKTMRRGDLELRGWGRAVEARDLTTAGHELLALVPIEAFDQAAIQ